MENVYEDINLSTMNTLRSEKVMCLERDAGFEIVWNRLVKSGL